MARVVAAMAADSVEVVRVAAAWVAAATALAAEVTAVEVTAAAVAWRRQLGGR